MSISSRLKSARLYTDDCGIRSARAVALLTFSLAATGCRDAIAPSIAPARAPASVETAGAITSSAIEFAAMVRAAGNRNQILISLRELNGPVISSEELERLSSGAPIRVALPEAAAVSVRRNSAAGPVSNGSRQAVLNVLARFGLQPDFPTRVLPMYAVSPSDSALEPLIAALLKSPHVDYLSVAEARAATPRGGPLGSNPADAKHDYHNIQAVWDSTRGEGGVVGVFDSGLAFGGSPEQYDLDARYLGIVNGHKRGIIARGFVGRYAVSCPLAERTNGLCWPYDDHGHGTTMVGLVGANDNDRGTVGVMPHGLTVSMKVTANAQWLETSCRGEANSTQTFCIHDADVSFALEYAAANAVKVVSMSWGENLGSAVHDYLRTAHVSGDVLFFAAVGYSLNAIGAPASWDEVIGVGGPEVGQGVELYRDLVAYADGVTIQPICPSGPPYYCAPSHTSGISQGSGSSEATAVAAGIAGLLRSYRPFETASQIRYRLISTAVGPEKRIDAFAALRATQPPPPPPPLTASIGGPTSVQSGATCSWVASASNGVSPYSYRWYRDGIEVATTSTYTGDAAPLSFVLRVYVTDGANQQVFDEITVATSSSAPPCLGE